MKRILVPIDFSKYSENAFLSALKIAEKLKAQITLINVISTLLEWNKFSAEEKAKHVDILDQEAEAKDELAAFVQAHKTGQIPIETVVAIGVPHEEILLYAKVIGAGLIIIGAYGRGSDDEKFIGSNIQKVMRKAPCPVLAVKRAIDGNSWKKMALATSLNGEVDAHLEKLIPLLRNFGPSLHLLYVNTPEHFMSSPTAEKLMSNLEQKLSELTVHPHIYNYREVENGIVEFCNSRNIGWITIVTDHKSDDSSYHIGVSDTVLFKTELPVLSIHTS